MLKVFLGFVVSVVVLLSSAYVPLVIPKAYAASASVLITQIQAGGVGAATKEFIVIYNNSPDEVDISGWCLTNKSNVKIVCFSTPSLGQAMHLSPYKHAVVVSTALGITLPIGTATITYVPTNQSSGSITGGSDTISLIDHAGALVDRQFWTTPISAGMQFERHGVGTPIVYTDSDIATDWSITLPGRLPIDETTLDTIIVDACPNIGSVQEAIPVGNALISPGECLNQAFIQLDITELLPNAVGSDDGQEFIELFNPNGVLVSLADYKVYVGPNYENTYSFPAGLGIEAHSYLAISSSDIPFTLLNSSSRVGLVRKDGSIISEVPGYTNPKEGESWALIDKIWQYTNRPTPGLVNLASATLVATIEAKSILQPCATNQYRSSETNRCRLLATLDVAVTTCKEGYSRSQETNRCRNSTTDAKTVVRCAEDQERNPATQRCRKIVTASQPAACKDGQERHIDTNRCRTITKMPSADYGVLGAETKSSGNWYIWAAVGGVLLLALGYAIWEWHDELGKFFRKYYVRALQFARIRK